MAFAGQSLATTHQHRRARRSKRMPVTSALVVVLALVDSLQRSRRSKKLDHLLAGK
ncbi:hypothetical protein HLY00_438 [Mycolicibacterium hippocampi]|uniref:Uncharacterized protein n=1 Tax=Mycolicibacterium hippocampi TaxID=659824 RepID=A0A850PLA7_9MYCO|nr:hypothetical protein [Mycolicibacterium hippocampi]